jgi:hypothetical protein
MPPRSRLLALLSLVLWATAQCSPAKAALVEDVCTLSVLTRIGAFYELEDFALPVDGGKLLTGDCKSWPGNPNRILAAFIYDDGTDEFRKSLLVTVYDTARGQVIASFKEPADYDSGESVSRRGALLLDLAPYQLAPGVRAFGVRRDLNWIPCASNGGAGPALQLFIVQGEQLKSMLAWLPMQDEFRESTDCHNPGTGQVVETSLVIAVEKTRSNGFNDLKIVARQNESLPGKPGRTKRFSHVVKFNGEQYDMTEFWRKYRKWYEEWVAR